MGSNFWVLILANHIFTPTFSQFDFKHDQDGEFATEKTKSNEREKLNKYIHKHLLRRLVRGGVAESLAEKLLHVLNDTQSCNYSVITRRLQSLRPLDGGYPVHVEPLKVGPVYYNSVRFGTVVIRALRVQIGGFAENLVRTDGTEQKHSLEQPFVCLILFRTQICLFQAQTRAF